MTEQSSRRRPHLGNFIPINTLTSQQEPFFQPRAPLSHLSANLNSTDGSDTSNVVSMNMESENECPSGKDAGDGWVAQHAQKSHIASTAQNPLQSSATAATSSSQSTKIPENLSKPAERISHYIPPRSSKESSIFNIPKAGKPRPEHHRAPQPVGAPTRKPPAVSYNNLVAKAQGSSISGDSDLQSFMQDYVSAQPYNGSSTSQTLAQPPAAQQRSHGHSRFEQHDKPKPVPLAKPPNSINQTTHAAPRPMFSSVSGFTAVNAFKQHTSAPRSVIDLTGSAQDPDDFFDPDRALAQDKFGAFDPHNYVDAAHANENIKALLEGAFEEDEDDKPKTRLRRRENPPQTQSLSRAVPEAKSSELRAGAALATGHGEEPEEEQDEEEEEDGTVDGLRVKLLPHQIDGVAWMLDKEIGKRKRNGVLPNGGILADDMGLGKTIQALSLILTNPRPSKEALATQPKRKFPDGTGRGTLVVAPLALIKQWEAEIKDKVMDDRKLKVLVHHGSSRAKSYEDLKKYDVVITTYQTLTSEHGDSSPNEDGLKVGCFGIQWYRIILDEAHSIKNRSAKMTQAAYSLRSVYRWCLTGTPMQNNLEELQSLIRFLQIKPYADIKIWKDQIGGPMKNGRGGLAMKRLQYFLKAFMKRRTKDVLKKEGALNFGKAHRDGEESAGFRIVARNVKTIEVSFSEIEQSFYDKLEARTERNLASMMGGERADYIGALVLLLRLRQTCNHPDLVRGNLRSDHDSITTVPGKANADGAASTNDMEDIASMFGGLSVETKKCDICQTVLQKSEASAGKIRCPECQQDLDEQQKASRKTRRRTGHSHLSRGSISDQSDVSQTTTRDEPTQDHDQDYSSTSEDEDCPSGHMSRLMPSAKITTLMKILDEESDEHKFIVFSEFTSMLDIVQPFLTKRGFRFVRYDGKMRNDDREASLNALRHDSKTRILLCSLRCGSLGLNLTAASRVVILEPFWNPFVEEQAIDRVHRLNQTVDVVVYRLTVGNSVEQRIIALQEKKRELARTAIEGGKAVGKLSMKDIMQLFRRDTEHKVDNRYDFVDTRQPSVLSPTSNRSQQPSVQGADPHFQALRAQHREKSSAQPSMQGKHDAIYGRRW